MCESVIELVQLTKRYGHFTAVDRLDLKIHKGEIFGLLGPNGAGKSTTILMMLGLTDPTSGTVHVCGTNSTTYPVEVRKKVGYLPEDVGFYDDMTGPENLLYTARLNNIPEQEARQHAAQLLERVGLGREIDKKTGKYSRGMRQRLGLADVLIKNPEVIILDEPTVGLDPLQIIEIRDLIKQLGQTHTVILSSHILSEVQTICEKILIISKGKLVASDTPENLERNLGDSDLIEIETKASPDEVRRILETVDGIRSISTKHLENGITWAQIQEKKNTDIREKVFQAFAQNHQPLLKLNPLQVSLEDVFMELTQSDRAAEEYAEKAKKEETEDMKDAGDL